VASTNYIWATGRRKNAIARVRIKKGSGKVEINKRPVEDYFPIKSLQMILQQPLEATDSVSKYDIFITVTGGGISGQAGAVRHGISRALVEADMKNRPALKKSGYLTRDSRMVERKKYGKRGARRSTQFSKR
jgi:small subunit ribosomal protein S9